MALRKYSNICDDILQLRLAVQRLFFTTYVFYLMRLSSVYQISLCYVCRLDKFGGIIC